MTRQPRRLNCAAPSLPELAPLSLIKLSIHLMRGHYVGPIIDFPPVKFQGRGQGVRPSFFAHHFSNPPHKRRATFFSDRPAKTIKLTPMSSTPPWRALELEAGRLWRHTTLTEAVLLGGRCMEALPVSRGSGASGAPPAYLS
jgi:hypothetical protein